MQLEKLYYGRVIQCMQYLHAKFRLRVRIQILQIYTIILGLHSEYIYVVTRIICLCKTDTLLKICDDISVFNNFPIQWKRKCLASVQ